MCEPQSKYQIFTQLLPHSFSRSLLTATFILEALLFFSVWKLSFNVECTNNTKLTLLEA